MSASYDITECSSKYDYDILFPNNIYDDIKRIIKQDITSLNISKVLSNFSYIKDNIIIIDARFFKLIAIPEHYEIFKIYLSNTIRKMLEETNTKTIVFHFNIKSINIIDLDKHSSFIINLAKYMAETFPDKLEKCYLYGSGVIIQGLYSLLSYIIDKKTQHRIVIVK